MPVPAQESLVRTVHISEQNGLDAQALLGWHSTGSCCIILIVSGVLGMMHLLLLTLNIAETRNPEGGKCRMY